MNKILIVILALLLIFIEGCSTISHTTGNGDNIKEKIKTIKENSRLTILLKNNEVLKGKYISCINDTLCVTFEASANLNAPISNSQFLIISHDIASYKIPVDQVKDIHIGKVDYKVVGTISGLTVAIFVIVIILALKTISNLNGK